jgi:methionyl-tRNA formyltransferase
MLHLHAAILVPAIGIAPAGHFAIESDRLLMGFAHDTALEVRELQVEGKKRMSAHDFINGYRPRSDEALGASS